MIEKNSKETITPESALRNFEKMRREAAAAGAQGMTDEEIDEEIRLAREETIMNYASAAAEDTARRD